MLAIECKTQSGKLSSNQKRVIEEINGQGGLAFVARSLDDVKRELRPFLWMTEAMNRGTEYTNPSCEALPEP